MKTPPLPDRMAAFQGMHVSPKQTYIYSDMWLPKKCYYGQGSVLGFNYPLPEVSKNWGRVTGKLNPTYPLVSEYWSTTP